MDSPRAHFVANLTWVTTVLVANARQARPQKNKKKEACCSKGPRLPSPCTLSPSPRKTYENMLLQQTRGAEGLPSPHTHSHTHPRVPDLVELLGQEGLQDDAATLLSLLLGGVGGRRQGRASPLPSAADRRPGQLPLQQLEPLEELQKRRAPGVRLPDEFVEINIKKTEFYIASGNARRRSRPNLGGFWPALLRLPLVHVCDMSTCKRRSSGRRLPRLTDQNKKPDRMKTTVLRLRFVLAWNCRLQSTVVTKEASSHFTEASHR